MQRTFGGEPSPTPLEAPMTILPGRNLAVLLTATVFLGVLQGCSPSTDVPPRRIGRWLSCGHAPGPAVGYGRPMAEPALGLDSVSG